MLNGMVNKEKKRKMGRTADYWGLIEEGLYVQSEDKYQAFTEGEDDR